jgi:O-antigen ligase
VLFLIALGALLVVNFSPLSLLKIIKILEIIVFAYLIKIHLNKNTYSQFLFVLSLSLLFQSGLAIAQFFNHGSINGVFYWFGERNFSSGTPGIANAAINGALVLRPYGTFPHPNVLAGYLLMGIILIIQNLKIKQWFFWFIVLISSITLFLTLSRIVILLWVAFFTFYVFRRSRARFVPAMIIISILVFFLQPRFLSLFSEDTQSWRNRLSQSQIALAMFRDHPLTGLGLNQYLVELPKYMKITSFKDYQPVHNIYLLLFAETGFAGILVTLFFFWRLGLTQIVSRLTQMRTLSFLPRILLRGKLQQESYLIIVIIILGLFDHYFYTLQQGNLMAGLIIGIIISHAF